MWSGGSTYQTAACFRARRSVTWPRCQGRAGARINDNGDVLRDDVRSRRGASTGDVGDHPVGREGQLSPTRQHGRITRRTMALVARCKSCNFPVRTLTSTIKVALPKLGRCIGGHRRLLSLIVRAFCSSRRDGTPAALNTAVGRYSRSSSTAGRYQRLPDTLRRAMYFGTGHPRLITLFVHLTVRTSSPRRPTRRFCRGERKSVLASVADIS